MNRLDANRCRFVPDSVAGHYESYFQRANHPDRALAFWLRYTVFSPKGRPDLAVGELWALYFDGERGRISAVKQAFPLGACRFGAGDLDVRIGESVLTNQNLKGKAASGVHALEWDLNFQCAHPPLLLLPESMYDPGFPQAKALVAAPNARFDGVLRVDSESIPVQGWQGSQNHNWGSRHTDSYAWGQVAGFDGAPEVFLECSTARLRFGPLWSPALTLLVVRIGDEEIALNSLTQAIRTRGRFELFDWSIVARRGDLRVTIRIHAPRSSFVGLDYPNPPGGSKTCLNTKLAACELTVEQAGRGVRKFMTRHRAAFEILTDRADHGVGIVV